MVRTDEFALVRFDGDREKADAVYAGVADPLVAEDVADAIAWMATRPAHVNIDELVIRPRAQAAQHKVHREPAARVSRGRVSPWRARMQTIGLVGGMSWESSAVYYRDLNLGVQKRLGGLSSPRLVLSTVDFAELTDLEDAERWDQIGTCSPTPAAASSGPAPTSCCCARRRSTRSPTRSRPRSTSRCSTSPTWSPRRAAGAGSTQVGFIGTTVAMSDGFFTDRMAAHGLEVLVPPTVGPRLAQPAIYEELVHGHGRSPAPAAGWST